MQLLAIKQRASLLNKPPTELSSVTWLRNTGGGVDKKYFKHLYRFIDFLKALFRRNYKKQVFRFILELQL